MSTYLGDYCGGRTAGHRHYHAWSGNAHCLLDRDIANHHGIPDGNDFVRTHASPAGMLAYGRLVLALINAGGAEAAINVTKAQGEAKT